MRKYCGASLRHFPALLPRKRTPGRASLVPAHAGLQLLNTEVPMADKEQPRQPTHRAYSVVRRKGQEDYWLNVGLVFPHPDSGGFNVVLQVLPLDGKIVCREIREGDEESDNVRSSPSETSRARQRPRGR
jgi:hypothetical protein